ncbi:hypothetical protein ACF0H5_003273 [Mactra antiquata]
MRFAISKSTLYAMKEENVHFIRLKCIESGPPNTVQSVKHVTPQETIKEDVLPEVNDSEVGVRTGRIEETEESQDNTKRNWKENTAKEKLLISAEISPEIMENKGQVCDDCGQLFHTVHDVQRHFENVWCPELRGQINGHEELSYSEQDEDTVEDNMAYVQLWKRARESND